MSRIGKRPVDLPEGVTAALSGQTVEVKGPRARSPFTATDDVSIAVEDGAVVVTPRGSSKRARQQWGMTRTMSRNMVHGVQELFTKELEIQGVGYRAQVQGSVLKLNLGLSHEVDFQIPSDVTVKAPKPTELIVEGHDRQRVGQVAAEIRDWPAPRALQGQGIRYKDEYIFQKEGKKK